MHFELSDQQSDVLGAVRTLLSRHAGPERMQALGGDAPAYDAALDVALEAAGFGAIGADPDAGALEAALVAEEVARHLGVVSFAARALVAVGLGVADLPAPIAVTSAATRGPVRFAADAATVLVVGVDAVRAVPTPSGTHARVRSRFGYPFGDVAGLDGGDVLAASPVRALAWWRVAVAVEMAGTMDAALDLTVRYVSERKQFGKSIGSFQALQHRLAELHVLVQGAHYLALEAAFHGAPEDAAAAALTHASSAAKRLPGELHQMSGAMGFATEYPLHLWTMRLPALAAEARAATAGRFGAERHLVALRWPGSVA